MTTYAEQVPETPIEALEWLRRRLQEKFGGMKVSERTRRAIQHEVDGFSAWWFARHGTYFTVEIGT